jgi:hypothetical protein
LKLIRRDSSQFCLPSTGEQIDLDTAIQSRIVHADLIDEQLETFKQSFEFEKETEINSQEKLHEVRLIVFI